MVVFIESIVAGVLTEKKDLKKGTNFLPPSITAQDVLVVDTKPNPQRRKRLKTVARSVKMAKD